jgi:hypothetical protein
MPRPVRVYGRNYGRVPDELLWDTSVSSDACRLYAALTRYGQRGDRIAPPRKELAAKLGWSLRTYARRQAELVDAGALYVEHSYGENGRQEESAYWLDGRRPPGDKPDTPPGDKPDTLDGDKPDTGSHIQEESASPNGDGPPREQARDGRADTLIGKCVTAIGGKRPVEMGAFVGIVDNAHEAGVPDDVIVKACVAWWNASKPEPVQWLTGHLGEAQRRWAKTKAGAAAAREAGHDGEHDSGCWCAAKGAPPPPPDAYENLPRPIGRNGHTRKH